MRWPKRGDLLYITIDGDGIERQDIVLPPITAKDVKAVRVMLTFQTISGKGKLYRTRLFERVWK